MAVSCPLVEALARKFTRPGSRASRRSACGEGPSPGVLRGWGGGVSGLPLIGLSLLSTGSVGMLAQHEARAAGVVDAAQGAAAEPDTDVATDGVPEEDLQDFEQVQAALEGLTDEQAIQKLKEHLRVHATCPNREVLEAQLVQLGGQTLRWSTLNGGARVLYEPQGFLSADASHRMRAGLQVGLPPWVDTGLLYQQPLTERLAVTGLIGGSEGLGRASVMGRATVWERPDNHQKLVSELELRLDVGNDSRFQVEPRLQYARTFQQFELQAFAGVRVRLNSVRVRVMAGVSGAYALSDQVLVSLEAGGYVRPVSNAYTGGLDWGAFSYLAAGGAYLIDRHWSVEAGLSVVDLFRYRRDYSVAVNGQVTYRFGATESARPASGE